MAEPTDGILLVDKEEGETSHGVVRKIKVTLGGPRGKKVGHAGTLDPFATGLLIILLGQGTKLSRFVMSEDKHYLATLKLGAETDTLDPTGRVVRTRAVPELSGEYVQKKAGDFVGEIEQVPPMFSAVKHKGRRAYSLARQGVRLTLQKRKVRVSSLSILSLDPPWVTMDVRCSGGTYIRSLGADLAKSLGTVGHITSLRRLAIGPFRVEGALSSRDLLCRECVPLLIGRTISMNEALPGIDEVKVGGSIARRVRQGYQPSWEELAPGMNEIGYKDGRIKLVTGGELVAILNVTLSRNGRQAKVNIERVFS